MTTNRSTAAGLPWLVCVIGLAGAHCGGTVDTRPHVDASTIDVRHGSDASSDARVQDAHQGDSTWSDAALDSTPDAAPPFTCTQQATTSSVLDGILSYDPANPHPGDTVTVIVKSQRLDRPQAPTMDMDEVGPSGTTTWHTNNIAGGKALYYYAISNVQLGDHCLLGRIAGNPEISGKFTVSPRHSHPPHCHNGIFKVTRNHQWTCDEQPDNGNEWWIYTYDANGDPLQNVTIRVAQPATTVPPIFNADKKTVPTQVETDSDGVYHGYDYWPINDNGYMVFNFSVDGCASDVATEITTGWWQADNDGCTFCPNTTTRNVWGHWSYTVIFQVDPTATQACVVPSDHAGQTRCRIEHIHHDPNHMACWDIR